MLNSLVATISPAAPAPVAGYKAWYDASDTATISKTGSNVTQWNDKSANALNLVQATGIKQPLSGTRTQNGKNMIDFDGSDDVLSSNASAATWQFLTNNTNSTVFAVLFVDTAADYRGIFDVSGGSIANVTSYTWAIDNTDKFFGGVGTNAGGTYNWLANSVSSFTDNTAAQFAVVSDTTNATAANRGLIYKNGTLVFNSNTYTGTYSSSNPSQPLNVGGLTGSADSFDGGICEIIIYNSILSSGDITKNVNYLATKWGL